MKKVIYTHFLLSMQDKAPSVSDGSIVKFYILTTFDDNAIF